MGSVRRAPRTKRWEARFRDPLGGQRTKTFDSKADAEEQQMLVSAGHFWDDLSGYAKVQSTRPQTIGYSLADSPAGLAAWMYAMFQDTCGTPGDAEGSLTWDQMLDGIMLYWLPNTAAS